jgi:hypothetical protein
MLRSAAGKDMGDANGTAPAARGKLALEAEIVRSGELYDNPQPMLFIGRSTELPAASPSIPSRRWPAADFAAFIISPDDRVISPEEEQYDG